MRASLPAVVLLLAISALLAFGHGQSSTGISSGQGSSGTSSTDCSVALAPGINTQGSRLSRTSESVTCSRNYRTTELPAGPYTTQVFHVDVGVNESVLLESTATAMNLITGGIDDCREPSYYPSDCSRDMRRGYFNSFPWTIRLFVLVITTPASPPNPSLSLVKVAGQCPFALPLNGLPRRVNLDATNAAPIRGPICTGEPTALNYVFSIAVPPGQRFTFTLDTQNPSDAYYWRSTLRVGGACPGSTLVGSSCSLETISWLNTGNEQTAYVTVSEAMANQDVASVVLTWSVRAVEDPCGSVVAMDYFSSNFSFDIPDRPGFFRTCGSVLPEVVFSVAIPPFHQLVVHQPFDFVDSYFFVSLGGATCPGTHSERADSEACMNMYGAPYQLVNSGSPWQTAYVVAKGRPGTHFMAWRLEPLLPASCVEVTSLNGLAAPQEFTTRGSSNSYPMCNPTAEDTGLQSVRFCGTGPERIFFIDVAAGTNLTVWQVSNSFNSVMSLRWGGSCPGDRFVTVVDHPDDARLNWVNTGASAQRAYIIVDGATAADFGAFRLFWSSEAAVTAPAGPFVNLQNCPLAVNLNGATPPFSSTTRGLSSYFNTSGGPAPERIFFWDVPPGSTLRVIQTFNDFKIVSTMRYRGACPGLQEVTRLDEPRSIPMVWINKGERSERAYVIVAGRDGDSGAFTLVWCLGVSCPDN